MISIQKKKDNKQKHRNVYINIRMKTFQNADEMEYFSLGRIIITNKSFEIREYGLELEPFFECQHFKQKYKNKMREKKDKIEC